MPADLHYDILHRLYEQSKLKERIDQLELIDENRLYGANGIPTALLPEESNSLTGIIKYIISFFISDQRIFS